MTINTNVTSMVDRAKAADSAGGVNFTPEETQAILTEARVAPSSNEALSALRDMGVSESDARALLRVANHEERQASAPRQQGPGAALERPDSARTRGTETRRETPAAPGVFNGSDFSVRSEQSWFQDFIDMLAEFFTGGNAQTVWGGDVVPQAEHAPLSQLGHNIGAREGAVEQLEGLSRDEIVRMVEQQIFAANPELSRDTNAGMAGRDARGVHARAEIIADGIIETRDLQIERQNANEAAEAGRQQEIANRQALSQSTISPVEGHVPAHLFPGMTPEQLQNEVNQTISGLEPDTSMAFVGNGEAGQLSTGQTVDASIVVSRGDDGQPRADLLLMVGSKEVPSELVQAVLNREAGSLDRLEQWVGQQDFTPPLSADDRGLAALELYAAMSNRGDGLRPVDQASQARAIQADYTLYVGGETLEVPAHLFPDEDGAALQARMDQRHEAVTNGNEDARYDSFSPVTVTSQGQDISAKIERHLAEEEGGAERWSLEVSVGGQTIPDEILQNVRNNAPGATEALADWLGSNALLRPPAADAQALASEVASTIRNDGTVERRPVDRANIDRLSDAHLPIQPAYGNSFTVPAHLMGGQEAVSQEVFGMGERGNDINFGVDHEAGRLPSGHMVTAQVSVERPGTDNAHWEVTVGVGGHDLPADLLADVRASREGATERLAEWAGQQTFDPPVTDTAEFARSLAGAIRNEAGHELSTGRPAADAQPLPDNVA